MKLIRLPALILFLLLTSPGNRTEAQAPEPKSNPEAYTLRIQKAKSPITLDGKLDEADWKTAQIATKFYQNFPYDTSFAQQETEVMVTYDDKNLYIGAICRDPQPGNWIVQSLKRDFSYPKTDAFAVYIDPFLDKTNGFNFTVSPLGVQREGLLQNGGNFGVTTAWDNRWASEVRVNADHWAVEIAIPFKTLRYKSGIDQWRINFSRNNLKINENSSWVPVPRNFNIATLAFTGLMIWDQAPAKAGRNLSLIPYALGAYQGDYQAGKEKFGGNAGGDAKVAITSSLNLDLTFNPDFSQVEVDRQVTNLDRFSIFFPERRQFFIENSDLFDSFGFTRIRPFFSRRIGLDGLVPPLPVPILAGARLSGKVNNNWRIGAMSMQTQTTTGLSAQNYTVAAVQRKVFARSNIGALFVNRQGFDGSKIDPNSYSRQGTLEYNLASKNGKFQGKAFYQRSWDNLSTTQKSANAAWFMYNTRRMTLHYNHEFVDKNYNADVGFVPRLGYFRLEPNGSYYFLPKNSKTVIQHGPKLYSSLYWDSQSWQLTDRVLRAEYTATLTNRAELFAGVEEDRIFLTFPFDPTRSGATPIPDSTYYTWRFVYANYTSNFRKPFNWNAFANYGGFWSGTKLTYGGELSYRAQPWGIFGLTYEQNSIKLPDPNGGSPTQVNLFLIGPRVELSFTRSLFFTTFFQYNTQAKNFNINARFQWRFAPMSDLYLVWTDNYTSDTFSIKNRALILKLNYWFSF